MPAFCGEIATHSDRFEALYGGATMTMVLSSATRRVGRYALVSYLGSGGMSDVYAALHTGLRKRVALKVLRQSLRHDQEAVRRFLREGECAARVRHPNVVDVSDVGVDHGVPYLVMELLEGETLAHLLARGGPLPISAAVDVMLPILEAVAAAHAAGVLHRDIKPANILLARTPDGVLQPKLVDFGIARMREHGTPEERALGTPHYMSPEQARGEPLDERSDQYAIASVFFELLTGKEPFSGDDVDDVVKQVARGVFPSLSQLAPALAGSPIEAALWPASAHDPAQRYPSVMALAHALVPFASERMQSFWISREDRAGMTTAPILRMRESTTPARAVMVEQPNFSRNAMGRSLALSARALAGAALLGIGLLSGLIAAAPASGVARERTALALADDAPRTFTHREPIELPAGAGAPLRSELPPTVALQPAEARVELDGVLIGRGSFARPDFGGDATLHALRISARGYVSQVMLFRGQLDVPEIALERRSRR